jgi:hypothetical protein
MRLWGVLLVAGLVTTAGNEQVSATPLQLRGYIARIDVGAHLEAQASASPLSPAERDLALSTFRTTAGELGLRCTPSKRAIIKDSYDLSLYQLSSCQAKGQVTRVQLADASDHVTVEVFQLGNPTEPPFFTRCRTRFAEALQAALPKGQVRVQYPYPRERSAETMHTEPPQVGRPTTRIWTPPVKPK